jgi:membrane protein
MSHTGTRSGSIWQITKAARKDFSADECGLRAAALSYSTVFALPPLLIVLIKVAGLVWDPAQVQHSLESAFGGVVGSDAAVQVRQMIASGEQVKHGALATIVGIVLILLGATGAFLSLQSALNAAWEVKPDPKQGGIRRFFLKRLLSFGMVLGLAFLLVASLAVTAAITSLGGSLGGSGAVMQIVNVVVTTAVLSVLFAAMFKFLPDAVIRWRSVWTGAIATAVLFEVGKFVIGMYLGQNNPANAFGAAKALGVIFVWIYYAGMILLFGAEFTQQYAKNRGHGIQPKKGAVRFERQERIVRPEDSQPTTQRTQDARAAEFASRGDRARINDGGVMQEAGSNGRSNGVRMLPQGNGSGYRDDLQGASMGELFRRLSTDGSHLVQQEIQLAKTELQENAARAAKAGAKIGTAAVIALPGLMAITAALVIGLGIIINSYWVSALIVGVVVLGVAGMMAKGAIKDFKLGLAPRETVQSVKDDVDWAKRESTRVKQEMIA